MSALGDAVDSAIGNLFFRGGRRDRGLEKLIAEGERLTGIVDGYRVKDGGSEHPDSHWVSLTVNGTSGTFRATVRQTLMPHPERAPLGTRVDVLHRDGKVAVDWLSTLRAMGADTGEITTLVAQKTLKEPLPPGIDDNRLRHEDLEKGTPDTATVTAIEDTVLFGMPTQNKDLHVTLRDGRTSVITRAFIPHYAVWLMSVGATLPVAVDPKKPDKITIDWKTAAENAAR